MNTTKSTGHRILLNAAKSIFNGGEQFSCLAIMDFDLIDELAIYHFYAPLFSCEVETFFDLYEKHFPEDFQDFQDIHGDKNPKNYESSDPIAAELREIRTLALLFAAAIYKTDGNIME